MGRFALLLLLAFASLQLFCFAVDDIDIDFDINKNDDLVFYESFDEPFEDRWIVSNKDDYKGVWKHSKSEGHDDYGLLVSEKARKYAIVKQFDEAASLKDGTTVLQFETRLQSGLECGGAYLKYLRPQEAGWRPKEFDNDSPYSIMFGPDRCGTTNKVHFIFKHKNPKNGEYVEHHLKHTPAVPSDKLTHVYTATLKRDKEVRIMIDGQEKKKASFLSANDFDPPLIPPKTIPDPDDKKPEGWDDRARIPDPNAVKPDVWDDDAPMEIEDLEAVKPEGWLDDEPDEIDDPEATKPEDWDDEEDGVWEPPKMFNPKCETAPGCGEWKRPMKSNPAYKGKWSPPLIDNPNYKGIWKAREIPNPNYFEIGKPDFEPIAGIGIEIWTMQEGILFDNILIAKSENVAKSYRETKWKPKFEVEKERYKAEDEASASDFLAAAIKRKLFDFLYEVADMPFLSNYKTQILYQIERAEKQPNLTMGVLVSIVVIILTIFLKHIFGGKDQVQPSPKVEQKPYVAETTNDEARSGGDEKEEGDESGGAPRRRRRET
ncbi:hypothetical protein V6N13_029177 [Hibiscus sabdariffa]